MPTGFNHSSIWNDYFLAFWFFSIFSEPLSFFTRHQLWMFNSGYIFSVAAYEVILKAMLSTKSKCSIANKNLSIYWYVIKPAANSEAFYYYRKIGFTKKSLAELKIDALMSREEEAYLWFNKPNFGVFENVKSNQKKVSQILRW